MTADPVPSPSAHPDGSPGGDPAIRTSLAWSRSLLGCVAVGVLIARGAWVQGLALPVVALPLALVAAAVLVTYGRQVRLRRAGPAVAAVPPPLLTVVVSGLALLGAVIGLAGHAPLTP